MNKSPDEGYVYFENAELFYKIHGSGLPFVFLHGNMQDSTLFAKQIEFFAKEYMVITIDSRGHGKSSFGGGFLTVDLMAMDVLNVLDSLGIEQAIVLGFSDGGNIALRMAEKAHARILALIVISPNRKVAEIKPHVLVPIQLSHFIMELLSFIPWCHEKAQLLSLMAKEQQFEDELLMQVTSPTFVLAGQLDFIKLSHLKHIAGIIPQAKIQVIPKVGHNFLAKDTGVNVIIKEFLAENGL